MATRLYLLPTIAPSISPAFDASWSKTTGAVRRIMGPTLDPAIALPNESVESNENVATSPSDVLVAQFVSPPLASSHTFGGTLKGQMRVHEDNADADYRAQLVAYVVNSAGTSVVGTLLGFNTGALASEWAVNTNTNRTFPLGGAASLAAIAASAGDRIVIEVGFRSHNSHTNFRIGRMQLTGDSASDLPENETATAADNAWMELSDTVSFADTQRRVTTVVAEFSAAAASADVQRRISALYVEGSFVNDKAWWDIGLDAGDALD